MRTSSSRKSENSRSLNQLDFQSWMEPKRSTSGWTFCPIASLLLVGQFDRHVARPLANPGGSPERPRTVALECRPLVDVGLSHRELVGDELVVVLRVGDGRVEQLQNVPGRRARGVRQYGTRLVDRLAANVVDHEPRLARGAADVLRPRPDGDGAVGG